MGYNAKPGVNRKEKKLYWWFRKGTCKGSGKKTYQEGRACARSVRST